MVRPTGRFTANIAVYNDEVVIVLGGFTLPDGFQQELRDRFGDSAQSVTP